MGKTKENKRKQFYFQMEVEQKKNLFPDKKK